MAKLLICEDEPRLCFYLGKLCEKAGMEVMTCATGKEAISQTEAFSPDVLVTDWLLKDEIDGLVLSRELKKNNPSLRTIVITGLPVEDARKQSADDGIFAYVSKPFEFAALADLVKQAAEAPRG